MKFRTLEDAIDYCQNMGKILNSKFKNFKLKNKIKFNINF